MEAIAAASSLAGLISLARQCVNGAQSLKALFSNIASASKTVNAFIRDINELLKTLNDVEVLLTSLDQDVWIDAKGSNVTSLRIQLEDCLRDISRWLTTARDYRPASGRGAKGWFKRFWVAVNKDAVKDIREEMARRRAEVNTSLLVLTA